MGGYGGSMSKRNDLVGEILENSGEAAEGLLVLVKHLLAQFNIEQLEDVLKDLYDVKPEEDEDEEDEEEEEDDDDVLEDFDDE